ncbi:MAG TPA: hypothetical protein PKA64_20950, partial [Myxococcota bacterium]|nr:hypothetical protein [Myxococcota bacterium]
MTAWGLDLGTSNSALARRAPDGLHDRLITLPAICRRAEGDVAPPLVPSAVRVAAGGDLWTRLGRAGFVSRRRFW